MTMTMMSRAFSLLLPLSLLCLGPGAVAKEKSKVRPSEVTFLGVEVEEETEQAQGGARITRVVPDSPASRAGLEEGDVVVQFDGEPVYGPGGLTRRVRERTAGDDVAVVVVRDGGRETLSVELGSRATEDRQVRVLKLKDLEDLEDLEDLDVDVDVEDIEDALEGAHGHRIKVVCRDGDCERKVWSGPHRPLLGVQLVNTTPELNRQLGGAERSGLLISKVVDGSAAEDAGIRVGDLIVSVDEQEVSDVHDVHEALHERAGESVRIQVVRDGASKVIEVELPRVDREAED